MNKIGFKNFRRFKDFPAIDLAPITFLVGENNAGKSTVVKGILALTDYFKSSRESILYVDKNLSGKTNKKEKKKLVNLLKNQEFNFNTNYLTHIGTFKRALYNKAENEIITFNTKLGPQDLTIEILGDRNREESVGGKIINIVLDIKPLGFQAKFDLQSNTAYGKFYPILNITEKNLYFIHPRNRKKALNFLKSISKEYVFEYKITNYWKKYTPDLLGALLDTVEIAISATMEFEKTKVHIGDFLIEKLQPLDDFCDDDINFLKQYTLTICQNSKDEEWMFIFPMATRLMTRVLSRIEYLYAHAVTQTVIYNAKDTNDYLSKTVNEFASLSKAENDYRDEFIKKWMKEFNIGSDYDIHSVGGEAHIVKIKNEDGSEVNLADKGMGSIQLMVLLFRLAITLPKNQLREDFEYDVQKGMRRIIIIEEPEQNLHPMLQSKLADLLFTINKEYGYKFIIETHSEYLIRKTQVIVSEMKLTEEDLEQQNPFKVYYFPSEGIPYDMKYRIDGCFANEFGTGFFDEASNLAFKLF